jgi:hypothetical protein
MTEPTAAGPEGRDRRNRRGDDRPASVTDGAPRGTSGVILRAFVVIALVILTIDSIDVLTLMHDAARSGHPIQPWTPMIDEYSSGAGTLGFAGLAWLALRLAWPGRARWPRLVGVHLAAGTLFSVGHVASMLVLRMAVFGLFGVRYHWALVDFPYEYRKDLPAYLLIAAIFWISERLSLPTPAAPTATVPSTARTFDVVDGAKTIRVPVDEIVSARSAGNYVEFHLSGGGAPMMRTTLAEVEQALGQAGFVRCHRSWIVNVGRVRTIEPAGSGDYRVTLDEGTEAPISRRYPEALARLRSGLLGAGDGG